MAFKPKAIKGKSISSPKVVRAEVAADPGTKYDGSYNVKDISLWLDPPDHSRIPTSADHIVMHRDSSRYIRLEAVEGNQCNIVAEFLMSSPGGEGKYYQDSFRIEDTEKIVSGLKKAGIEMPENFKNALGLAIREAQSGQTITLDFEERQQTR